jgi:polysaccharide export outer membrane protein
MRTKLYILTVVISQLMACTVIPGMHMSPFSNKSSLELPVTENNATIIKKLNIKTITAQLVVNLEKDFNSRSLGPDNVANHYFDYRIGSKTIKGTPAKEEYNQYLVGPRDILNITVWEHP